MGERILVTGGAGFVGSHLVDSLVEDGHDVFVFDNLESQVHPAHRPDDENPGATYLWGDVCDWRPLKDAASRADVIFHLAALVGVGQSQYQMRRYMEVNAVGTATLLDVLSSSRRRCRKLVLAGSMSSYGEGLYVCETHGDVRPAPRSERQLASGHWELCCPECAKPVRPRSTPETASLNPQSIYAVCKTTQEQMVMAFGRAYQFPVVTLRYFNIYGPRQSLMNPYTGVASIFLARIMSGQQPVLYEDGQQARDFVSVHDVVQANRLAMTSEAADGEAFNVGSGQSIRIRELAESLSLACACDIAPRIVNRSRKGDIRHCFADIDKARRILGYDPRVSLTEGLDELVAWSASAPVQDRFDEASRELAVRRLA